MILRTSEFVGSTTINFWQAAKKKTQQLHRVEDDMTDERVEENVQIMLNDQNIPDD